MKVLLVDDSRTMRNLWKRAMAGNFEPLDITEGGDGQEALTALEQADGPFDLILLDWNMPNMDGLTFLKQFRTTDKTTPIIMVTTEAEKPQVITALKAGANNYLIKPFIPEDLVEKINATLKKTAQTTA